MHKGLILGSFLILVGVLLYLTYVTFMFHDREYQPAETALIKEHYEQSIRNDKLYPGGQDVMNRHILNNLHTLEELSATNPAEFNRYTANLLDSMFTDLRRNSNMDSLFAQIKSEYGLSDEIKYVLTVQSIVAFFQLPNRITLFDSQAPQATLPDSLLTPHGFVVSGTLKRPLRQNQIISYTVSNSSDYSYETTFSLYADRQNRYEHLLLRMTPTLLMALLSLASIVVVYYVTYRKWIKQKKLTEMKSDFLNSITHEFNTPLATIIVANKNMQNEKIIAHPANIQTLTNIIERQAAHLEKLFGQVMDVTTMHRSTLSKETLDINLLVEDIVSDYQLKVSKENVSLTMTLPSEPTLVELNRFFFTTMMLNLFENAVKYNRCKEKRITVAVVPTPSETRIQITDNGIGIPARVKEHIFEKFYRLKEEGTQSISGLGLGLYYVHQCVKSHYWTLSVKSKDKIGSQFNIHIPRKP